MNAGALAEVDPAALARAGQLLDFTEAWLRNRRLSEATRQAYRRDVTAALGTVAVSTGPDGPIDVLELDGMTRCNRWALVLPAAGDEPR